jgi:hypothetical protein
VVAGAADDETATMNDRVVAFARGHLGKRVGNGECTSLAVEALRSAGARRTPLNRGDGDYVWGRPVASFRDAIPGDLVQFRDAVFRGKRRVTSRRSETWRYEYPHHTAVVAAVRENGRVVIVLHQNVGSEGSPDEAKRLVTETTLRTDSLQKGGKVWIYRPIAPAEPFPAPETPDWTSDGP